MVHSGSAQIDSNLTRYCPACKNQVPLTDYSHYIKRGKLSPSGYCKSCNKIKCKQYGDARKVKDPNFVAKERERSQKARQSKDYRGYMTWQRHKRTAEKRGLDFSLTQEFVDQMFVDGDWKCCKTGIAFDLTTGRGIRPFSPSIDRIDSSKGYVENNVQLVCTMYNFAKNAFSESDVYFFAEKLLNWHAEKNITFDLFTGVSR